MAAPSGPTQPLRFNKTIVNLPAVLTPDSIFAVRKGAGIELYVSDMTGSIAYKSNSPVSVDLLNSNTVSSITSLSFNPESGFSVTDLGDGHALVSVAGSGTSGADGNVGATGEQGIQGNVGATGEQGIQGPAGLDAPPSDNTTRIDFYTDDIIYRGEAIPASIESDPVWRIEKIEFDINGDVSKTWASGTSDYDKVWDNRLLYEYL
jgi:hypothetical protein